MNSKRKIHEILSKIKREIEISPTEEWVKFEFNQTMSGHEVLTTREEKLILRKLMKDNVLEIHLPDPEDNQEEAFLSLYTPEAFMMEPDRQSIDIKVLPKFYFTYWCYHFSSFNENTWNLVNPFWIIWQLIKVIILGIKKLWYKSKLIPAAATAVIPLLAYEYSTAWKNINKLMEYLKNTWGE